MTITDAKLESEMNAKDAVKTRTVNFARLPLLMLKRTMKQVVKASALGIIAFSSILLISAARDYDAYPVNLAKQPGLMVKKEGEPGQVL